MVVRPLKIFTVLMEQKDTIKKNFMCMANQGYNVQAKIVEL